MFLMDYKRKSGSAGICILISFKIHIRRERKLKQNTSTVLIKKETELEFNTR